MYVPDDSFDDLDHPGSADELLAELGLDGRAIRDILRQPAAFDAQTTAAVAGPGSRRWRSGAFCSRPLDPG